MKFLLLAVLLVIVALHPVPEQTDKANAGHDNAKAEPPSAISIHQPPLARPSAPKEENSANSETDQSSWCKRLLKPLVDNWPLLIVAVWGIIVARKTLKTIDKQADLMDKQAALMKGQLNATQDQVKAAMGAAVPTLMLNEFRFIVGERSLEEELLFPRMIIGVKNYGQSPAIMKSFAVEFTCGELPSVLRYPSIYHFNSGTALEYGESMPLAESWVWPNRGFSNEDASEIAQGKKTLTVYGCVWYDDVFGSPVRKLTFCKWGAEFWPDGQHLIWIDCENPRANEGQNPN